MSHRKPHSHTYEKFFQEKGMFFGKEPAPLVYRLLQATPPKRPLRVLELGSGEGRNAIFLARNGYRVTAIDISPSGIEKTLSWASRLKLHIDARVEDLHAFVFQEPYDIIFSTWSLQFMEPDARRPLIDKCRAHTRKRGINAFSVFVQKPFLKIPCHERHCNLWTSGEVLSYYWDWSIEYCNEEIFDCTCGGDPHKHAANSVIARRP